MKKLLCALCALSLSLPGLASAMDHGAMGGHGAGAAAKPAVKGKEVRTATVEGYRLAYRLIDAMEAMKGMAGHDMSKMKSHHLMVYVTGPDGKAVADAKAGYLVVGPDKAEQKTMALFMEGGYGADVDLKARGAYQVKTKIVAGGKNLVDDFAYTVK